MKPMKKRLLSLLLTLVTILSLLPTAAFAASNTGSGLKITTNQAYWSTRLLANGTPYSYRPPLADGKLVYCMDSGLGYHYATPSYLNSFSWTSGSGADADAVLQSAVTNSGLSEMDAATVENVKWMMTYLNDCKESNVGQLFMAVQTYVWENQSYKDEPGGDGDAGGYANADTYELYLSLIDSLLAKKAAEDAGFQRQIEEYTFMLLDLRPGAGNMLGAYWEYDPPWLGSFGMLNTSECPKDAVECSLWQILQATAPSRYSLSQTACLGILRRAACRGKSLPPLLEAALRMQAGLDPPTPISGEAKAYHINQRNEGIDLDGVSGALMATQNLQMQTFIAGFSAGAGASAGTIGYQEDVAPTLKGRPSGNCMPSILCINDQGGQIMECSENVTGTLRAQEHGHQPLILRPTGPKVYENHGIDGRYTGPHDVAPTMSARYGTGGNNIPLVQQEEVICIAGNAIDRQPQNGGNGFGWQRDISYTLTTSDRHSVYARQRVDQFRDDEIASTESARQHKDATDLICQPPSTWDADCRNLIRRLTPLECERLQGYPDGWTDVPGASDSARYKALGNSVAIPCVEYLMQRVAMVITLDLEWDF